MKTGLRNNSIKASNDVELARLRKEKWNLYVPLEPIQHSFNGNPVKLRPGLTLTPFANAVKCNAHCTFCSEDLVRKDGHIPTAKNLIRNYGEYFRGLKEVLKSCEGLNIGLSLSGLEATAEPVWLLQLLALIKDVSPYFSLDEKVMYTNGSGFLVNPEIIEAIEEAGFDRIELSRCHYNETINQEIMRFNRNQPVWKNEEYKRLFNDPYLSSKIKNSCILTKKGVNNIVEVETYLDWTASLGVQTVVFREMSRLDHSYQTNTTSHWIEDNRIEIDSIIQTVASSYSDVRKHWSYQSSTLGYYYYNEHFLWKDKMEVILETSSYPALMQANNSGVIQKLIYHSNGNLTGDWDADNFVIAQYKKEPVKI
ncbi:MAG TPA: radical SAM protein [Cytophagaceae bacterium]|nr:radical SAM protein [Cytophagaceae bacterium]